MNYLPLLSGGEDINYSSWRQLNNLFRLFQKIKLFIFRPDNKK